MGGTFSKSNRPKLEGAYFNFQASVASPIPISPGTIVALPAKHSWGPSSQIVAADSLQEWQSIFGPDTTTDAYQAVRQIFKGEGVSGRGGAGRVLTYRFAGTGAKKAKKNVKNTTEAAEALKLQAKYNGTYGNNLSCEVVDVSTGIDRLIIKLNGVTVETFDYPETNITKLGELITAESDWVELAAAVVTGKTLDQATDGALTEGNDGTTAAEDWVKAQTALDTERFAAIVGYGLVETSWLTALRTWIKESNERGHRFFGFVGKASGTTLAEAGTLATEMALPEIIVVDGVTLRDVGGGVLGGNLEIGGNKLCARAAGIFAARGEYQSLSAARLADTEIVSGRSLAQQVEAFELGVVTFARDSHAEAPTHIKTGLSSWTATAAAAETAKPYLIYRQPKYVRTMHGIETELTEFAETEIIGLRPIDGATRDAIIAEAKRNLEGRQKLGVVLPGWTVGIDQNPPPTDLDEFIALSMSVKFGRALEQVFFTVSVE